jgi:hypothetical protein
MSNVDVTREAKAIYWLQAFSQYNNLIHLSVVCLCMNFFFFLGETNSSHLAQGHGHGLEEKENRSA